jgi:hypothetical protein
MDNRLTVLEEIIKNIGEELYQKWYNALAIEDRTEEASKAMSVIVKPKGKFRFVQVIASVLVITKPFPFVASNPTAM